MTKYRIQGKIYTVIEDLENIDPQIIYKKQLVKNSKKEHFYFVHSVNGYFLYDMNNRRVAETYSIQECE